VGTDKLFTLSGLPFPNHVRRLALSTSGTTASAHADLQPALAGAFLDLLDLYISMERHAVAGGWLHYHVC